MLRVHDVWSYDADVSYTGLAYLDQIGSRTWWVTIVVDILFLGTGALLLWAYPKRSTVVMLSIVSLIGTGIFYSPLLSALLSGMPLRWALVFSHTPPVDPTTWTMTLIFLATLVGLAILFEREERQVWERLTVYLSALPPDCDEVVLTPREIKRIIGRLLPSSAASWFGDPERFWANDRDTPQSRAYKVAGWEVTRVEFGGLGGYRVTFRRTRGYNQSIPQPSREQS